MSEHITGTHRDQTVLFPDAIDKYVEKENPVRFIDAFVDSLNLEKLGFKHSIPADTGRPSYNPSDLLKLYIYGYLNQVRSSRKLEKECHRNVEVMWLMKKLVPVFVQKRFGEEISIQYPRYRGRQCSLVQEMKVEAGTREDWLKLAFFHYRGHKTAVARHYFKLVRGSELCGVIVYAYPPPACFGRRLMLSRMSIQELVFAFCRKAGMKRVAEQESIKSVAKISQLLVTLGFDLKFLSSKHCTKIKLESLNLAQLACLREGFLHKASKIPSTICQLRTQATVLFGTSLGVCH